MTNTPQYSDQISLFVEGMTCAHCQITVGEALSRAGLADPNVDWRRGSAIGTPTAEFSTDRASEELARAGYDLVTTEDPEARTAPQPQSDGEYDLLIIGSGSAAFAAAIKASELGARIAMVERDTIGGTCVNVGCVPSKALLRAAEHYHRAGNSPFAGVPTSVGTVDLPALVAQKDELVKTMQQEKYVDLLDVYGIDLIRGEARFTGTDTVEADGREVAAGRFLVAAGAAPWTPPIEGIDEVGYLTSTTALELTDLPAELIVVGANAIGLELGQLFAHLGSRVTFVEVLDRVAPFEEPELSAVLQEHLESLGCQVLTSSTITKAGRTGDRRWLDLTVNGTTDRIDADQLLVATGRRANTASLGLDIAGVETHPHGNVVVDDRMATSNPACSPQGTSPTSPSSSTWPPSPVPSPPSTPSGAPADVSTFTPCPGSPSQAQQ